MVQATTSQPAREQQLPHQQPKAPLERAFHDHQVEYTAQKRTNYKRLHKDHLNRKYVNIHQLCTRTPSAVIIHSKKELFQKEKKMVDDRV